MWLEVEFTMLRAELDAHGRPLRTVYEGEEKGEERYTYDDQGRIVEIEECLVAMEVGARTRAGR